MKKLTTLFLLLISLCSQGQTANDFSTYLPYTGKYSYGMNPGYYGTPWNTRQICELGTQIGSRSFRMQIYDSYLTQYGDLSLIPDYDKLKSLGTNDVTVMVGGVSDQNKWNPFNQTTVWNGVTYDAGKMFKGMYEPIWINGGINPANSYAVYIKKVIDIYGKYISTYEIWNEPDFTYKSTSSQWFTRDPYPEELENTRANVQYYIRLLRISWEVIKKYQPSAHVATGGLGIEGFADAVLRNTDNPDGGKVTADYPLKGGAYFDLLSFHTYPVFSTEVKFWTNESDATKVASLYPGAGFVKATGGGGHVYYRNSDACVRGHFSYKNKFDALLKKYGYNGATYPEKQYICTETGLSRVMDNDNFGSNEGQRNYQIKAHIISQKEGHIKQNYWYQTADYTADGFWNKFGCHFAITGQTTATPSDQGIALKTMSGLLYGKSYDAAKTTALNLPSTIDGGAFTGNGTTVYCLWAKTTKDLSEQASAAINLPACTRKEWDFSKTNLSQPASGLTTLGGTPSFFEVVGTSLPVQLISFTATKQGKTILLKWQSEELNFDHYELEKSYDRVNFTLFGKYTGGGSNYSAYDYFPQNINYYRLKMVDKDGTYSYSKTVSVSMDKKRYKMYNLAGQQVGEARKGMYILKYEDGTSEIIINK